MCVGPNFLSIGLPPHKRRTLCDLYRLRGHARFGGEKKKKEGGHANGAITRRARGQLAPVAGLAGRQLPARCDRVARVASAATPKNHWRAAGGATPTDARRRIDARPPLAHLLPARGRGFRVRHGEARRAAGVCTRASAAEFFGKKSAPVCEQAQNKKTGGSELLRPPFDSACKNPLLLTGCFTKQPDTSLCPTPPQTDPFFIFLSLFSPLALLPQVPRLQHGQAAARAHDERRQLLLA